MADNYPYHLGLVLAKSFHNQAINPHVSTIFAGPYITCLIKGMSLVNYVDLMTIDGGYSPITFCNLHKLGLTMAGTSRGDPSSTHPKILALPPATTARPRSPPSPSILASHYDQGTCFVSVFQWLQRSVTMIAPSTWGFIYLLSLHPLPDYRTMGELPLLIEPWTSICLPMMLSLILPRVLHSDHCIANFLFFVQF